MYKIIIYTDGACSGNPGPMGAGALVMNEAQSERKIKQISQPLGYGTNNIAELMAISLALSVINPKARSDSHITIHTDSQYCIGVLSKSWKIKENLTLILSIRELITEFDKIDFVKVAAHQGNKYNQWADNLATQGVKKNLVNVPA